MKSKDIKELKVRLAKLLMQKSYLAGDVTLTSGHKSTYYFDCKQTALHPEGCYLLGKILLDTIASEAQGVGGMTLGADPLVSAVTLTSYIENRALPGFIIRKTPKGHGTKNYLEGMANFSSGQKVAILEDVVTTGGTLLQACQRVKEAGLEIAQIICVLDREEGGGENLNSHNYKLQSLFTKQKLFELAHT